MTTRVNFGFYKYDIGKSARQKMNQTVENVENTFYMHLET